MSIDKEHLLKLIIEYGDAHYKAGSGDTDGVEEGLLAAQEIVMALFQDNVDCEEV